MRICTRYEVSLITKCTLQRASENETALKLLLNVMLALRKPWSNHQVIRKNNKYSYRILHCYVHLNWITKVLIQRVNRYLLQDGLQQCAYFYTFGLVWFKYCPFSVESFI